MKLSYFKIREAFDNAKLDFSYGSGAEKLASAAKLLGKSVANVGILAINMGVDAVRKMPEDAGERAKEVLDKSYDSMSPEQIEAANKLVEAGAEARESRLKREEEEWARAEDKRLSE